nr:VOC family protein [Actinomycetales bacterium]
MTALHAYLNFPGTTREAMTWYHSIFGGELNFSTFGEYQAVPPGHSAADNIMHASLTGPITMYAADSIEGMMPVPLAVGNNINLSLMGTDEALLRGWFDALAEGGTVIMSLEPQVWGDVYGALVDRYGINWMVNIGSEDAG